MMQITPQELKEKQERGEKITVFDIREEYECDIVSIGATHFPMGTVMENLNRIPKNEMVVFCCKTGQRAEALVDLLNAQHGFSNLYNLKGGVLGYVESIDPSLPTY